MAGEVRLEIGPPPVADTGAAAGFEDPVGPAGGAAEAGGWDDPAPALPEVPEAVVRGILATLGTVLAISPLAVEEVPDHWLFTERELNDLTPPLTRIVNARPQLRAAAARGDEVTVAVQLAGFTGRNLIAGSLARKQRAQRAEEDWLYADEHREADGPAGAGDGAARGAAGGQPGGWVPPPPGTGIHPPAA